MSLCLLSVVRAKVLKHDRSHEEKYRTPINNSIEGSTVNKVNPK